MDRGVLAVRRVRHTPVRRSANTTYPPPIDLQPLMRPE